jgi:4-amino-4-deoxy-L-arabinose transferase-like glycosyltransferase
MTIKDSISFIETKKRLVILGIVIFSILLGVFYSFYLGENLTYFDEQSYYTIARNIKEVGFFSLNGSTPTAYRPPGYPFLLAFLMLSNEHIIFLRIFNYLAFALSIYLLYKILCRHSNPLAGILSAFICLCYPIFFTQPAHFILKLLLGHYFYLLFSLFSDMKNCP